MFCLFFMTSPNTTSNLFWKKTQKKWKITPYGCFQKLGYPQIIHFNRVFHYFHHPFWWFSPYFWNHPYSNKTYLYKMPTFMVIESTWRHGKISDEKFSQISRKIFTMNNQIQKQKKTTDWNQTEIIWEETIEKQNPSKNTITMIWKNRSNAQTVEERYQANQTCQKTATQTFVRGHKTWTKQSRCF